MRLTWALLLLLAVPLAAEPTPQKGQVTGQAGAVLSLGTLAGDGAAFVAIVNRDGHKGWQSLTSPEWHQFTALFQKAVTTMATLQTRERLSLGSVGNKLEVFAVLNDQGSSVGIFCRAKGTDAQALAGKNTGGWINLDREASRKAADLIARLDVLVH